MSRAGDIWQGRYVYETPLIGRAMAIRVRLRDMLKKRGMAQTELQARSGLGYSTINALYHGKTERSSLRRSKHCARFWSVGWGTSSSTSPKRSGCA